jgi:phage/plasmid-like protein (TIGR03299 family)
MSHELSFNADGNAEMAFVGEVPWHGLGHEVPMNCTPREAAKVAHLDWQAELSPVTYTAGDNSLVMPGKFVISRNDTNAALGIVSGDYNIVQPSEAVDFIEELVSLGSGWRLETLGSLFGGSKIWALASVGEGTNILNKDDVVKPYLCFSTSLDGSMATEIRFTSVRVVCNNTLQLTRSVDKADFKMTHKRKFDAAKARTQLGLVTDRFGSFIEDMRKLASRPVGLTEAENITCRLIDPDFEKKDKARAEGQKYARDVRNTKAFEGIMGNYLGHGRGSELEGVRGNLWGWLNGVTEYADYSSRAETDDGRIDSFLFGKGAGVKAEAYNLAMELVA